MAISTYVAVPTLAVGDKLTATRWNTIVTAFSFLLDPPMCTATNVAATSYANNTRAVVPLATEDADTGGSYDGAMHSTSSNNSRVIATTAGRYRLTARESWAANATGRRLLDVTKNTGGTFAAGSLVLSAAPAFTLTAADVCRVDAECELDLAANDYVEMWAYQTSGGNLALDTAAGSNYLTLRLIGS